MNWLRKGVVHLLAFVLFVALVGLVVSTSLNHTFGTSDNIKAWLAQSGLYDKAIPSVLKDAEAASIKDGNQTSIPLSNDQVQQAAEQAFSSTLVEQSTNTFIDSNYAWLRGETATPKFTIDLTKQKSEFAKSVGSIVETRLASLPACSVAQLAALQIPVDPLKIDCRPSTLDPKTEGTRVAAEVSDSDFLSKPVLTADSLNQNQNASSNSHPYYTKLSDAPKVYQFNKQAPFITAAIAIVCILAIIAIAPTRRRGVRRVGFMLLDAGLVLLVIKLASDTLVNRFQNRILTQTFDGQLKSSYTATLHNIEASMTQTYLLFGIVFVVLATAILVYLLLTRSGKARDRKASFERKPTAPAPAATNPAAPAATQPQPEQQGRSLTPTPRAVAPNTGVRSAPPLPAQRLRKAHPTATTTNSVPPIKRRTPPRPPRLIQ